MISPPEQHVPVQSMQSCIYRGLVHHARHQPHEHRFTYQLFMMYLDLAELDQVFSERWLWSTGWPTAAWFRRGDHLGDPRLSLDLCVRELVLERTEVQVQGPIRLLTNLRYLGFMMNPVSYYYCFDCDGQQLQAVVVEIHNTPWGERHCYVITPSHGYEGKNGFPAEHPKDFHVSPFMPMDLMYHWHFMAPAETLNVQIALSRSDECVFEASLALKRQPITGTNLIRTLVRFPCMTVRVFSAIYWQAFRLWMKKTPYFAHPKVG